MGYLLNEGSKEGEFSKNQFPILWGDEIEGHIIKINPQTKQTHIQIENFSIFQKINESNEEETEFHLLPEYGAWMIETTPKDPYFSKGNCDRTVENMRQRTKILQLNLQENEHLLYSPIVPFIGTNDFFDKKNEKSHMNDITQSLFIDDRIINQHPRFITLTQNIRQRRKEKVQIKVPIFPDINTSLDISSQEEPFPGFIYMDAMAFGMGSSCLQTTFSAKNLSHARVLYDQLAIISPLFLALTAGSPIFKGKLANVDTRWDIIAASVDCRTPEERDKQSKSYIPKSRYGSISLFISEEQRNLQIYNDLNFPLNQQIMDFTKQKAEEMQIQIDQRMLQHIGFLFIRDPLVVFEQKIEQDNSKSTSHFESIQSTNWNSVRIKPPPAMDSKIGWRVEFRTMECQITDDENAAFALLSSIFVRLFYQNNQINFYMPISKVDENFERAKLPNAIINQKFWFRTNVFDDGEPLLQELYLREIFFGKDDVFEGLFFISESIWEDFLSKAYKQSHQQYNKKSAFYKVWDFVKEKTFGKRKTLSSWIRDFVQNHPAYQKDSIINQDVNFDLVNTIVGITSGNIKDDCFKPIF
ncbi:hypothetical protein IMG5_117750 [Ichthyophthirius multifiliis]|uniref:Glutamate--cysteine ligase n=1 Tax=Ichthyophthirius multifiliis TaxID=5932 RepID=G0QUK2_ICHMU|nr:hypothetical protein IMG5_117750 [Ichthyophthirius multifiliis]EGR31102.1 hypothetical protein IMG5_117750 [Ichthyophthirius multifiliis]|eukprot:XP_004034588.1 hypothetical protein IMG5_117750 [Ichthyophthirius multifiliis]